MKVKQEANIRGDCAKQRSQGEMSILLRTFTKCIIEKPFSQIPDSKILFTYSSLNNYSFKQFNCFRRESDDSKLDFLIRPMLAENLNAYVLKTHNPCNRLVKKFRLITQFKPHSFLHSTYVKFPYKV